MAKKPAKRPPHLLAEVSGWYGTSAIMLAYLLVSFGWLEASGVVYQLLNLSGALCIIVLALSRRIVQSVVLNVFWAGIAAIALLQLLL